MGELIGRGTECVWQVEKVVSKKVKVKCKVYARRVYSAALLVIIIHECLKERETEWKTHIQKYPQSA